MSPLLEVEDLEKYYFQRDTVFDRLLGRDPVSVKAVDGLSFEVNRGETLGLVGESGCGKSTTSETLLRLREATGGAVRFDGEDVFEMDSTALREFRRSAQIVFQDPFSSLDPRMTVGEIITEPLAVHDIGTKPERRAKAKDLLERVGLSAGQIDRYPHEFSGGQRQRIGIARALSLDPEFIVLDEPVSALDVSVQAQVLNLLQDLQEEFGLTYLFVAHDLSVVRHICDRVAVMYLGEIVEVGPTDELFDAPKHPYTQALLESVPRADMSEHGRRVEALQGDVPSPRNPPSGCRFRTRCPQVIPPADIDIEQEAYREVMNLRQRVAERSISLEMAWDTAEEPAAVADGGTSQAAFNARLDEEFFTHELSGENREVVDRAFEALADGDWERAGAVLRERFESVCESRRPVLQRGDHPAACHLYDQP